MQEFFWIASFPKSGNTWLRFIAAELLFNPGENRSVVNAMIPDIHDWMGPLSYQFDGAFVAKTHFPFEKLPATTTMRKAIYVVRHPLDVVVSTMSYMEPQSAVAEQMKFVEDFIEIGCIQHWVNLEFGSWEQNVESWLKAAEEHDVLVLRYEDLLEDPHAGVSKVAAYFGQTPDDDEISRIVDVTSFKNMRALEQKEREDESESEQGFFKREGSFGEKPNFMFMRSGRAGDHLDVLDQTSIDRLRDRFGPTMSKLGYD